MNKRVVKIAKLANDKAPFIEWMDSLDKKYENKDSKQVNKIIRK